MKDDGEHKEEGGRWPVKWSKSPHAGYYSLTWLDNDVRRGSETDPSPPCPPRVLAPKGAGSGAWLGEKAYIIIYVYFRVEITPTFRVEVLPKRGLHGAAIGPMMLFEGTPTTPSRGFILSRRSYLKSGGNRV